MISVGFGAPVAKGIGVADGAAVGELVGVDVGVRVGVAVGVAVGSRVAVGIGVSPSAPFVKKGPAANSSSSKPLKRNVMVIAPTQEKSALPRGPRWMKFENGMTNSAAAPATRVTTELENFCPVGSIGL
jgi:hypothetical protein